MRELQTVVTRKGQVTVPAEIRRALGIKEGDRVAFVMEDDEVRLVARGSVVERTAGALRSSRPAEAAEELREAGERAIAEGAVERTGG
jgi:antitoxin PrlF